MKAALKTTLNIILLPLICHLAHKNEFDYKDHQYMTVIKEFEGCARELIFLDLPGTLRVCVK